MDTCDVTIIGAGPYGLTAAAHLAAGGLECRVFGEVMGFWKRQMPIGMLLRSERDGSNFSDPAGAFGLAAYEAVRGGRFPARVPLDDFVRYGDWFQQQAVPVVDPRTVRTVESTSTGFRLTLDDGQPLSARRVVAATGLGVFARWPAAFAGLPRDLVSHTSDERDLGRFRGRRVVVVGAGQSALESAALLSEGGAAVEVVTRGPVVHWLAQAGHISRESGRLAHILYPPGAVGPLGINWIVQLPDLYRALPRRLQETVSRRALRPAGSGWLRPRLTNVVVTTSRAVAAARTEGERLRLNLDDGSERVVDHVLLGTGYQVDVMRYPFLAPDLARRIARRDGHPDLSTGFECSVPGLHFLGAASAASFGPLMRFVAGTEYTGRALARKIRAEARESRRSTVAEVGMVG
jgi:FAD-dependent urate hydroxylase